MRATHELAAVGRKRRSGFALFLSLASSLLAHRSMRNAVTEHAVAHCPLLPAGSAESHLTPRPSTSVDPGCHGRHARCLSTATGNDCLPLHVIETYLCTTEHRAFHKRRTLNRTAFLSPDRPHLPFLPGQSSPKPSRKAYAWHRPTFRRRTLSFRARTSGTH